MLHFKNNLLKAILDAEQFRMVSIPLDKIGGDFMTDQQLENELHNQCEYNIHSFKIDRNKNLIFIRWKSELSNDEIDSMSISLIGPRGRRKRK